MRKWSGAGRENLLSAVNAKVALDPVSVSFDAVPSGSGQTQKFSVTLTNLGTSTKSFSLTTGAGSGGVTYSLTPSSVSLGAGASSTATITMSASKGAVSGSHPALLTVSSGGSEVAHAVVCTLVK
jgi:minor extracellular serine protease Vpr